MTMIRAAMPDDPYPLDDKGDRLTNQSLDDRKEDFDEKDHKQTKEQEEEKKADEQSEQWKWEGITLGYWNCRGVGERLRMQLQYLGLKYKDQRYDGVKGRRLWFNKHLPQLAERHPGAALPYLVDGKEHIYVQPDAIQLYLCIKTEREDLLGRDFEQQMALADAHSVMKDFYPHFLNLCYGKYNESFTFEHEKKDTQPQFDSYLVKFSGLLKGKQFMAGGLTWVDFGIADFLQCLHVLNPDYFKHYPDLLAYQRRVWALPELEEYFTCRFRERPINNFTATWK